MQTFKQYLKEGVDIEHINIETVVDVLNHNCRNALWMLKNDRPIFRGNRQLSSEIGEKFGVGVLDTSGTVRKSANTSNYYTVILDHIFETKYSQFPLRSKSIICSTDYNTAKEYGGTNSIVYVVPFDNAKIGETKRIDIWDTEVKFGSDTISIYVLNDLYKFLNIQEFYGSFVEFSNRLKNSDKENQERFVAILGNFSKNVGTIIDEKFINELKNDFIGKINEIYEKYAVKTFNAATTSNMVDAYSPEEVWVGGKCVVMTRDVWYELDKKNTSQWAFLPKKA